MNYPETFKQQMVSKMSGPCGLSASALSEEINVNQTTLSRWLREAARIGSMSKEKPSKPRRPQDWTSEEKLAAVMEASGLSEEELGGYLRSKGLHEAQLEEWRKKAEEALSGQGDTKAGRGSSRRVRELERELRRKDKALAEAAALLILKKKLAALWEDEDDATKRNNEE